MYTMIIKTLFTVCLLTVLAPSNSVVLANVGVPNIPSLEFAGCVFTNFQLDVANPSIRYGAPASPLAIAQPSFEPYLAQITDLYTNFINSRTTNSLDPFIDFYNQFSLSTSYSSAINAANVSSFYRKFSPIQKVYPSDASLLVDLVVEINKLTKESFSVDTLPNSFAYVAYAQSENQPRAVCVINLHVDSSQYYIILAPGLSVTKPIVINGGQAETSVPIPQGYLIFSAQQTNMNTLLVQQYNQNSAIPSGNPWQITVDRPYCNFRSDMEKPMLLTFAPHTITRRDLQTGVTTTVQVIFYKNKDAEVFGWKFNGHFSTDYFETDITNRNKYLQQIRSFSTILLNTETGLEKMLARCEVIQNNKKFLEATYSV